MSEQAVENVTNFYFKVDGGMLTEFHCVTHL